MEEVIMMMLDLEDQAQSVVKGARQAQKSFDKTVEQEIEAMREEIARRAEKRCKTVSDLEEKEAKREIARIKAGSAEKQQRLSKRVKEKKDDWVNEIIDNIIS